MSNNLDNGISAEYWNKINETLSHFPHIEKAVLFGSRAKGTHKKFSDIDIALIGNDMNTDDLLKLETEIDDLLLPYEFDFCIYKNITNKELKDHIDRRGIVVYNSN